MHDFELEIVALDLSSASYKRVHRRKFASHTWTMSDGRSITLKVPSDGFDDISEPSRIQLLGCNITMPVYLFQHPAGLEPSSTVVAHQMGANRRLPTYKEWVRLSSLQGTAVYWFLLQILINKIK